MATPNPIDYVSAEESERWVNTGTPTTSSTTRSMRNTQHTTQHTIAYCTCGWLVLVVAPLLCIGNCDVPPRATYIVDLCRCFGVGWRLLIGYQNWLALRSEWKNYTPKDALAAKQKTAARYVYNSERFSGATVRATFSYGVVLVMVLVPSLDTTVLQMLYYFAQ
jgi:hypothetical protein